MADVCGSKPAGGSCWCDGYCLVAGDCCEGFDLTCAGKAVALLGDMLGGVLYQLLFEGGPSFAEAQTLTDSAASPMVQIASGTRQGLGMMLDSGWVLTAADVLEDDAASDSVEVTQQDSQAIDVLSITRRQGVALLRVDPTQASLPEGFHAFPYEGTLQELDPESGLVAYGTLPGEPTRASAAFYDGHWSVALPGSGTQAGLVGAASAAEEQPIELPLGAPILTRAGELAALVSKTETVTVPYRLVVGEEQNLEVTLYQAEPLTVAPDGATLDTPSVMHWVRSLMAEASKLDCDKDGRTDLWGVWTTSAGAHWLVCWPLDANMVAAANPLQMFVMPENGGNWVLAGRGSAPSGYGMVVWHEQDTGEVVIQKLGLLPNQIIQTISSFTGPEWQIKAVADVNGDGIDDILWESEDFAANFYWIMNDVGSFDALMLQYEPNPIIRSGQWFGGLHESLGGYAVELVAAGQFPRLVALEDDPESGNEQATADLLWRVPETGDTYLSSMVNTYRLCSEIEDPLMLEECESVGWTMTYEMKGNLASVQARAPYWSLAGVADFNGDGIPDPVWHATGSDAGGLLGTVEIWLSSPEAYEPIGVVVSDGDPLVVDPETYRVSIR